MELIEAGIYRDGGTLYASFKEDDGTLFHICLDGRPNLRKYLFFAFQKPKRNVFIGANHPSEEKAIELPYKGIKEKEVIETLVHWINSNIGFLRREQLDSVNDVNMLKSDIDRYHWYIIKLYIEITNR